MHLALSDRFRFHQGFLLPPRNLRFYTKWGSISSCYDTSKSLPPHPPTFSLFFFVRQAKVQRLTGSMAAQVSPYGKIFSF